MTTNPHLPLDQKIVGDIYTSPEAMDNLSKLCDEFGSRFGGTEGERLAAEFIRDKFEEYGLKNVHMEPIEYLGWTRGEASLEIVNPDPEEHPLHQPATLAARRYGSRYHRHGRRRTR